MAALRFLLVVLALLGFFLVGTPLQWLVARLRPAAADRIPILFCRSLLRLSKVTLDVEGRWPEEQPVMIVPNHISWIDILALGALTPFCFLAKSEVARWPIVSAFATVQGTVFVDRRRRRSIPAANRALAARMLEGRPVLLFAEGTTLADRCPIASTPRISPPRATFWPRIPPKAPSRSSPWRWPIRAPTRHGWGTRRWCRTSGAFCGSRR